MRSGAAGLGVCRAGAALGHGGAPSRRLRRTRGAQRSTCRSRRETAASAGQCPPAACVYPFIYLSICPSICLCLSISLPIYLSDHNAMHTRTRTVPLARTHAHTHSATHARTHARIHTLTRTHPLAHRSLRLLVLQRETDEPADPQHLRARTRTRAHTYTQERTHTRARAPAARRTPRAKLPYPRHTHPCSDRVCAPRVRASVGAARTVAHFCRKMMGPEDAMKYAMESPQQPRSKTLASAATYLHRVSASTVNRGAQDKHGPDHSGGEAIYIYI